MITKPRILWVLVALNFIPNTGIGGEHEDLLRATSIGYQVLSRIALYDSHEKDWSKEKKENELKDLKILTHRAEEIVAKYPESPEALEIAGNLYVLQQGLEAASESLDSPITLTETPSKLKSPVLSRNELLRTDSVNIHFIDPAKKEKPRYVYDPKHNVSHLYVPEELRGELSREGSADARINDAAEHLPFGYWVQFPDVDPNTYVYFPRGSESIPYNHVTGRALILLEPWQQNAPSIPVAAKNGNLRFDDVDKAVNAYWETVEYLRCGPVAKNIVEKKK